MSDMFTLRMGTKSVKARVEGSADSGAAPDFETDLKRQNEENAASILKERFEAGQTDGYNRAREELESEYNAGLIARDQKFQEMLSSLKEQITEYETGFGQIVASVSVKIAERILRKEIENKSPVELVIRESLGKLLGAEEVKLRLNPSDLELISCSADSLKGGISKFRCKQDNSVEKGGCLIETEIGNIDARISTQLDEISKKLQEI